MKLFRFIRNVWNSVFVYVFESDTKSFIKYFVTMFGGFIAFIAFVISMFGLGKCGKLMGLSRFMPLDRRDDLFGLGVMMLGVLLMIFFAGIAIFVAWLKLTEIWKKS